jgi:hypothetical protein
MQIRVAVGQRNCTISGVAVAPFPQGLAPVTFVDDAPTRDHFKFAIGVLYNFTDTLRWGLPTEPLL